MQEAEQAAALVAVDSWTGKGAFTLKNTVKAVKGSNGQKQQKQQGWQQEQKKEQQALKKKQRKQDRLQVAGQHQSRIHRHFEPLLELHQPLQLPTALPQLC